jgi:hypothetical protein
LILCSCGALRLRLGRVGLFLAGGAVDSSADSVSFVPSALRVHLELGRRFNYVFFFVILGRFAPPSSDG